MTQIESSNVRIEFDRLVPERYREQYEAVREIMQRIGIENQEINLITREDDNNKEINIHVNLVEHFDMAADLSATGHINRMIDVRITSDNIRKQLNKLKGGKQPGPDGIKPEIYRWIKNSDTCVNTLTATMNKLLNDRKPPEQWKTSKTILIPKKSKPKYNELRPIALTNVSYKIFMGVVKDKLVEHMERNDRIIDYQAGFTKNRRLEDNILLLKYCIHDSRKCGKPLIVTAIDFKKAFDSINRAELIKALMNYKCDPKIIDVIAKLYTNDSTKLCLNNREIGCLEITSGIRQGCTGSPWLFVMILNYIIDQVIKKKIGYRNKNVYMPVLFFADDGLLLANSIADMEKLIRIVTTAAGEIGLEINKEKSNVIIFNMERKPEKIEEITVVREIKYLGVHINDSPECFKAHKDIKIKSAQRLSNLTYSVIARSCNKLLIGKTYWKSVVIPSLLFASSVVTWNRTELQQLQRTENNVWRHILGAPGYTPVTAMRGDIGASCMNARDMKTKLKYVRYVLSSSCELLKFVFEEMYEKGNDKLIKIIKGYMEDLEITNLNQLTNMNDGELIKKINQYDEMKWIEEMNEKSTLEMYRTYKREIKEERFYDNTTESCLMFRARSDTLKLGWRKRFEGGEVSCQLCNIGEEETLSHFVEKCDRLQEIRREYGMEGKGQEEILLFSGDIEAEKSKKYLGVLWRARGRLLRDNEVNHG